MKALNTVEVIIPVYHPGKEFAELLEKLDQQTVPIQKIRIVHTIDGMKIPETVLKSTELVIEEIRPEEFDHGGTRNRAAKESTADVMVFMTQDAIPEDSRLMETLIRPLQDEKVAVVYARQMPKRECKMTERYVRSYNYPGKSIKKTKCDLEKLGVKTYFCSNVCAAYNRDIYVSLGGFEEDLIFNEDMIFAAKCIEAGYAIVYEASAKVIHSHNYTFGEQFSRNFDMAISQADHPEIFGKIRSEKEGIKMLRCGMRYFILQKCPQACIIFACECAAKYLGYWLGKKYKSLPRKLIIKFSMNKKYWEARNVDKC